MPVTTVSADQVVYVNGRPTIAQNSNTTNANRNQYNNYHRYRQNRYRCRAQQLTPRLDLVKPGSPVAVDCEGVKLIGEEFKGWRAHGVGRCSIVNIDGEVIYDTFVYYPDNIEHRPSPQWLKLGVKYKGVANLSRPGHRCIRAQPLDFWPDSQILNRKQEAGSRRPGGFARHQGLSERSCLRPQDFYLSLMGACVLSSN